MKRRESFGLRYPRTLVSGVSGFVLALFSVSGTAVRAEDVRKPKVALVGDLIVQRPGKKAVKIRIHYGKTHIRMDVPLSRRRLVTIVDRIKRETVLLLPHRREYMKIPGSARSRAATDRLVGVRGRLKQVGQEKIRGIAVTKYALKTKTAIGTAFDGHVWLTADDIMIQTIGKTPKGLVDISLHNLRRGPINPAMFVIPSGYTERKPARKPAKKKAAKFDR